MKKLRGSRKWDVTMQTSAQWFTPDPTLGLMLKIVGEDLISTEYARMNSMLKAGGGWPSGRTGPLPVGWLRIVRSMRFRWP